VVTSIEFIEGIIKIANVVLSLVAAGIAVRLFHLIGSKEKMQPWKPVVIALIFFMVQEVLGALRAFGIFEIRYLTNVVPAFILAALIWALVLQINLVNKK